MAGEARVVVVSVGEPPAPLILELRQRGLNVTESGFSDAEEEIDNVEADLVVLFGSRGAMELTTLLDDPTRKIRPRLAIVAGGRELSRLWGLNRDIVVSLLASEMSARVIAERILALAKQWARPRGDVAAAPAARVETPRLGAVAPRHVHVTDAVAPTPVEAQIPAIRSKPSPSGDLTALLSLAPHFDPPAPPEPSVTQTGQAETPAPPRAQLELKAPVSPDFSLPAERPTPLVSQPVRSPQPAATPDVPVVAPPAAAASPDDDLDELEEIALSSFPPPADSEPEASPAPELPPVPALPRLDTETLKLTAESSPPTEVSPHEALTAAAVPSAALPASPEPEPIGFAPPPADVPRHAPLAESEAETEAEEEWFSQPPPAPESEPLAAAPARRSSRAPAHAPVHKPPAAQSKTVGLVLLAALVVGGTVAASGVLSTKPPTAKPPARPTAAAAAPAAKPSKSSEKAEAAPAAAEKPVEEGAEATVAFEGTNPFAVEDSKVPGCDVLARGITPQTNNPAGEASAAWGLARQAIVKGDLETANLKMCEAVTLHAESAALEGLALLYVTRRSPSEALRWVERAEAVRPGQLETRNLLGDVYSQLGDSDKALAAWLLALNMPADDTERRQMIAKNDTSVGRGHLRQGDIPRAERLLRRAVTLDPNNALALASLADACLKQGRPACAIIFAQRSLAIFEANPDAYLVIGDAALLAGDRDKARSSYERALGVRPDFWAATLKLRALEPKP